MENIRQRIPTPYADLNSVLQDLVDSIQTIVGSKFIGAYLQGSFAVGDFDRHSDVDFIIVIQEELSDNEVESLQVMHERIFHHDTRWAQHLEGSYFPEAVLRNHTGLGRQVWYIDNGSRSLERSDHCNTLLVRWVVREFGVTLAGPPPETVVDPISTAALRAEIKAYMYNWAEDIFDNPERFDNRFYQTYIVLNYCRVLHDLINGYPGSKRAGAEWAKANLDPVWSDLIDRTWNGRPHPAISVRQTADPVDFERTLAFVKYILDQVNQMPDDEK